MLQNYIRAFVVYSAAIVLPFLVGAQTCVPSAPQVGEVDWNDCSGQRQSCSGAITKLVSWSTYFPDGYTQTTALVGTGRADSYSNCNAEGQIVGPYPTVECWPAFFSPQTSDGKFFASDYDEDTYGVMSCCGDVSCQIAVLQKYVSGIICYPVGYHTTEVDHSCPKVCSSAGETCDTDACGYDCGYSYCTENGEECNTSNCSTSCGGGGGGGDDPGGGRNCEYDGCDYPYTCVDWQGGDPFCAYVMDPILVDLAGDGFSMTNVQSGVNFDFFGTGTPFRMSWTKAGAPNGWLTLDLNGDGRVGNGTELFGNAMTIPTTGAHLLGFQALAVYDSPASGGNGDGVIDSNDAVYGRLSIWVDTNHNGVTDAGEIVSLQQAGIKSISLDYKNSGYTDADGNQFRYRAQVFWADPRQNGRQHWAYDVILLPSGVSGVGAKGKKGGD